MDTDLITTYAERYRKDGYVSPVPLLDARTVAQHRLSLEDAEAKIGNLHYKSKVHTILRSPYELATHPDVLDLVEAMIGPNILLHNMNYIIKEPHTASYISWHQDLTYWGFDSDDQVSIWLALSPATETSGCMRMIPGSHKMGRFQHDNNPKENNVLLQSQTVSTDDFNEADAVLCCLNPGEASFHHGWTLHASMPNQSDDRRIGLNAQYLATHVRQTKHDRDTAMLVRGVDEHHHFGEDVLAETDLDPVALQRFRELDRLYQETAGSS